MDHISASQVGTYLTCGRQWYYRYIRKLIIPPGGSLTTGKALHKGLEKNFTQKIESGNDLHADEVEGTFEEYMKENKEETVWDENLQFEDALSKGSTLTKKHIKEVAPRIQPIAVEKKIELDLPGTDKFLLGYIDLIDVDNTIIDHKSSKRSKSQGDVDNNLQLSIYATHLFADNPDLQEVNVRIDNLVLKKAPEIKQLPSVRTINHVLWSLAVIKSVLKGIEKGIFNPAEPGCWMCSEKWCGYYGICHQEMREAA